jgi:hypothetical protein
MGMRRTRRTAAGTEGAKAPAAVLGQKALGQKASSRIARAEEEHEITILQSSSFSGYGPLRLRPLHHYFDYYGHS